MKKRIMTGIIGLVSLCVVAVAPVQAERTVVAIGSQQLTVHEDGELGDYYTLSLAVPGVLDGQELLGAYLEFYVDVDAMEIGDMVDEAPWLDVFALTQTHGATVDPEEFGTPAAAPGAVIRGESRRVLRDITEIVRGWMAAPQSNHGLIVGSLTGVRDGLFTVKAGVLGEGVVARLIVHHRDG
jgi:hypothetical protein